MKEIKILDGKSCDSCICLRCGNGACFTAMCEGARVEPEYYDKAIENCYTKECNGWMEETKE